jgi:hypothetical protein
MEDIKKSTIKSSLPINKPYEVPKLYVHDGDGRSASRGRGQNLAVLLNVIESALGRAIKPRGLRTRRYSVCKCDRAEVGKWNKTCAGPAILDDPLRVLTAKRSIGSQKLRHRVAIGYIFDPDFAGSRGERVDTEADDVSSRDGDTCEKGGRIGEPLIPGC